MQDRYTGDIGDYAKYSLLRALSDGFNLGVAWYLFPDETGTGDGQHIEYIDCPSRWRRQDPVTFDALRRIIKSENRNVAAIESSGILGNCKFSGRKLDFQGAKRSDQAQWRLDWFAGTLSDLEQCNLIFADPDNGLKSQTTFSPGQRKHGKSISMSEVRALSNNGRPAIIYHHNSFFGGGHDAEVRHWQRQLGKRTCAVRWRYVSPRTFFLLNCTRSLAARAKSWTERWNDRRVIFETCPQEISEIPPREPCESRRSFRKLQSLSGLESTVDAHPDRCIDYVELAVTDIARSKAFYGAAFGWTFTDYGSSYSEFSDGRMKGGFDAGGQVKPGGPLIVLYGTDLGGILNGIRAAGGKIVKPIFAFPGGRRFHFTDPDGHELAVWSER